jgi:uncharacterized protein (DUF2236 family)
MEERLASDDLYVVEEAREIGLKVAFDLPVPPHRRPALQVINLAVRGLLPARVRELYGIPWTRLEQAALDAVVRGSRLMRPLTPKPIRRGSSARDYDLVAAGEARRLAATR